MLLALFSPFVTAIIVMASTSTSEALSGAATSPEKSERLASWSRRWSENMIGWHEKDVHECLMQHGSKIIPNFDKADGETCSNPVRVFVPLCGKTVDMAFLAKHPSVSEVVGVDGIRKALEEFATEHPSLEITPVDSDKDDAYERLKGQKVSLLKGDFFGLDDSVTDGKFDAIWDRASLVAIQPELRESYADVMGKLIKPGGTLLLSTLDRRTGTPESMAKGPPFSVPESEVRRLYENLPWVESIDVLGEVDSFKKDPNDKARHESYGLTSLFQVDFQIKTKAA